MSEPYSPNLFLFQQYVAQVLKDSKKEIKTGLFEHIDPQDMINQHKNQHIDAFHPYFLSAMGHNFKTREIACINYQKLLRQSLVDKEHLPHSLISSVLTACSSAGFAGGSTSGSSSLGSASLAAAPQGHSLHIGNMVKTMLMNTYQPSSQLCQGLNYLLEGTRKKNAFIYSAMLQQVYKEVLVKYRQHPLEAFTKNYLQMMLDEVQANFDNQSYKFASRKLDEKSGKVQMAHFREEEGFGKFGRCFYCRKQAGHYSKEEWVPICGLGCRQKVKSLTLECHVAEPFSLLGWLLDHLPSGDEITLAFMLRQLQHAQISHNLQVSHILSILKILIHQLGGNAAMSKPLIGIVTLLMTRWKTLIPTEDITVQLQQKLERYFKVYLLEVLALVEQLPISKDHLDYINLLIQVLMNDEMLVELFVKYDSKFFEAPILARMFNLISQYAKRYGPQLQGLTKVVKNLMDRFVTREVRDDSWKGFGEFMKKREVRRIIAAFNKKPVRGVKMLLSLFDRQEEKGLNLSQSQISQKEQQRPQIIVQMRQTEVGAESFEEAEVKQNEVAQILQTQNNTEMEETPVEVQKYNSDNIINKRLGQLLEEHPSSNQIQLHQTVIIEKQKTVQPEEEGNTSMKKIEQPPKELEQPLPTIEAKRPSLQELQRSTNSLAKEYPSLTPTEIALFILQNIELKSWTQADSKMPIPIPLLSKTKVGQYFGTEDELVRKISMQVLQLFKFQALEIDDVMRIVMNIYALPKQTQQIERILGDLSLRLMGQYQLQDDTSVYQYIYLLLMVQTTVHNPQVRQSQKLSLETYLSMSKTVKGGVTAERAEFNYRRIANNSLINKMKFPEEAIFYQKYHEGIPVRPQLVEEEEGSLSRSMLLYLWEFLVIGLVLPGNNMGLFQTTILFGREGLEDEQKGFFQALRKSHPDQSQSQLLKLAIDYGNDLIGKPWLSIVSLLYNLEQTNDCSAILDKLFTNSGTITPPRMRDILQALLQFSSSQFRKDVNYTRQLFVLRHINSLIEYNINRFDVLAPLCWQLLRDYFKDICLHPRKEISMSAVDSLKQLSLKLVKLRMEAVPHNALISTFLYVFERSGVQMKDLIANVMLNLITSDLRGGWDSIYSILDVLDTKDKHLVVKLIGRLIGEVGLNRLGNLPRLHSICIKQLRICSDVAATQKLLSQLWQLSSFIDEANTWLQTIRSIKDIFKISLNPDIINIFTKLSNRCISGVQINHPDGPKSLDRQVLAQVIDVLMFLLDLKGRSKTPALITSLQAISALNIQFIIKHLIGNCGLLQIFRLFLSGDQKVTFSIFLKTFTNDILLPHLHTNEHDSHIEYLSYWCVNQYLNHIPAELFNLKGKDKDFEKSLTNYIGQIQGNQEQQRVLIQFHLSNRESYQKSCIHVIFLDIIEAIYSKLGQFQIEKRNVLLGKIEEAVLESFQCASKFNRLVLLRNFLWNNGFLAGKTLPGLLKQEHRSILVLLRKFPLEIVYKRLVSYLQKYRQALSNLDMLAKMSDPTRPESRRRKNSREEQPRQDIKTLFIYNHDTSLWVKESQVGIRLILETLRRELVVEGRAFQFTDTDKERLIQIILQMFECHCLPSRMCGDLSSTLQTLYTLTL